jgi:hypothetical protein
VRLFNFVVILILVTLATSATASENKRVSYQQSSTHDQLNPIAGESALASVIPYSGDYLAGSFGKMLENKTTTLQKQYTQGSFQAETKFKFPLNLNGSGHGLYSGENESARDLISHGYFDKGHEPSFNGDDEVSFKAGYGQYEGHWNQWNHGDWDDRVNPPVPEPETYALMLVGLMMLGALKYRKS